MRPAIGPAAYEVDQAVISQLTDADRPALQPSDAGHAQLGGPGLVRGDGWEDGVGGGRKRGRCAGFARGGGGVAGVGFLTGAGDEVVDGGGDGDAAAEAAELDFGAAALAADLDIEEAEDLVDEGAFGLGVGDVLVGDEGVVAGEEALEAVGGGRVVI